MNAELVQAREAIDALLAASLAVDDHINLDRLKITKIEHPPFQPGPLGIPVAKVPPLPIHQSLIIWIPTP